jgi:cytochrome c oxidase cbb3-type subunit 3
MKRMVGMVVLLLPLSGLFAGGCGGSEEEAGPEEAQAAQLQGPVPQKMREVAADPKMVEAGKQIFQTTCVGCHGKHAEGMIGIGPQLNSDTFMAAAPDEFLIRTITNGRAGTTMIAWGEQLKKNQIYSVVAYLRSLNPAQPATLDESPLQGDPDQGEPLFQQICAACHGSHGAGYQETANGTGIGRKAFLDSVSNGYLRYIIKHGKSGTKMRPFDESSKVAVANLNDDQIEDVIAYLRTNAW